MGGNLWKLAIKDTVGSDVIANHAKVRVYSYSTRHALKGTAA